MSIRITGGRAVGRALKEPVGPGVRPTSARVREALFSVIGQDLSERRVLDAFGGAGLIGLEAWSRGARVTVVEQDRAAFHALARRGAELGADWQPIAGDVLRMAGELGRFDGVFCDPPYALPNEGVLAALGPLATAWFVYESAKGARLPPRVGTLQLDRPRPYGDTVLWVYR